MTEGSADRLEVAESPKTNHHYRMVSGEEGVDPADLAPVDSLVMERIVECYNALEEGQKLVVLFGEAHSEPATIMPQVSCIVNLAKLINPEDREDVVPFIVGLESSYLDAAIRCLNSIGKMGNIVNPEFLGVYNAQHPEQTVNVIGLKRDRGNAQAEHSQLMYINACCAHGIPQLCCDAYDDGKFLIAYDQVSVDAAWDHFEINLSEQPLSASPGYDGNNTGFQVRNHVMAQHIEKYMEEWSAPIMVVPMGLAHIYGDKDRDIPHETSVVKLLEDQGYKTLVINLLSSARQHDFEEMVPSEVIEQYPDHVVIEGICGPRFVDPDYAQDIYGAPLEELGDEGIFDAAREPDFIYGTLVPCYSGEECPFNFDVNLPGIEDFRDTYLAFYKQALEALTPQERSTFFVSEEGLNGGP